MKVLLYGENDKVVSVWDIDVKYMLDLHGGKL